VPDHDDKGHMQVFYGVFNRADHGPVCYIAGHPQHEEIAQALVKHQFGSNAGIGARKNHGKRMLALCQFLPSIAVDFSGERFNSDKSSVPLFETLQCSRRRGRLLLAEQDRGTDQDQRDHRRQAMRDDSHVL
jgi:hypothetical protein